MRAVRAKALCALSPFVVLVACNAITGLSDLRNVPCVGAACADTGGDTAPQDVLEAAPETETAVDAPPGTCTSSPDPLTAAAACSPKDRGEAPCAPPDGGFSCPMGGQCIAPSAPGLAVIDYRVSHLRIWFPTVLRDVSDVLVHPQVNPKCTGGAAALNVLLKLDTTMKKLRVGSARPSGDGATYTFTREELAPSLYREACTGATFVPTAPIKLEPFDVAYTLSGQKIASATIDRTYIAVWDTPTKVPSTVPLLEASIRSAVISPDRSCIGSFDPDYMCGSSNPSQGWTTGGLIVGKIPLDEADNIPLPVAGCQTLCAVLADNPERVDGDHCKRGTDGKVIPFGDTCVGGADCRNAVWFSAGFAAQAVTIP